MRAAVLFISLFICSTLAMADESGRVRGQIVDPTFAAIANAHIRAIPRTTGNTRYRFGSENDGSFHFNGMEPGSYGFAISAPGFREKFIDNVLVDANHEIDLGSVKLALAGCDAPGTNCDYFGIEPGGAFPDPPFSRGNLKMRLGCVADIDKGEVLCTIVLDGPPATAPMGDHTSDFWLHARSDKHLYLEPRNGARLAGPNSAEADCRGAVFLDRGVRIDGLGPGSDLCVRSNAGRYSHLFFTSEVQPDSSEITVYYVTRK